MKQNSGYLCREVAGSTVILPVGPAAMTFNGMVTLNETGRFLWEQLATEQTEQSLTAALLKEYSGEETQVSRDIGAFLEKLTQIGALTVQLDQPDSNPAGCEGGAIR
ncbi:MAG: PqqD family protein [Oscillospiraceae bacterium]